MGTLERLEMFNGKTLYWIEHVWSTQFEVIVLAQNHVCYGSGNKRPGHTKRHWLILSPCQKLGAHESGQVRNSS